MDAVRTADGRREFIFARTPLQRRLERIDVGKEEIGSPHQLDIEAGIEHVGRGHALVHETCIRSDEFGEMGEKGDDVVLDLALDLVDARGVEFRRVAFFPDRLRRGLRDHAEFGHGVGGVRLDLEPNAKPRLRRPDRCHLRTGVARDHDLVFWLTFHGCAAKHHAANRARSCGCR
jgi:hypothetical protein